MTREQLVRLRAAGNLTPRERMWAAIRELRMFTAVDIHRAAKVHPRTAADYLRGLERAQVLRPVVPGSWELVRDVGIEPPGGATAQVAEAMWRAVKILGECTAAELAAAAGTKESNARKFLQMLEVGRYVVRTTPLRSGVPLRYRALPSRYTGPRPPYYSTIGGRRSIYDPNVGRATWEAPDE